MRQDERDDKLQSKTVSQDEELTGEERTRAQVGERNMCCPIT